MQRNKMRSEQEINRAVDRYADTVRRLCMIHLKSYADTEDIFQTVFLKYALSSVQFESDEHEKAWIIRVTQKKSRRSVSRRKAGGASAEEKAEHKTKHPSAGTGGESEKSRRKNPADLFIHPYGQYCIGMQNMFKFIFGNFEED